MIISVIVCVNPANAFGNSNTSNSPEQSFAGLPNQLFLELTSFFCKKNLDGEAKAQGLDKYNSHQTFSGYNPEFEQYYDKACLAIPSMAIARNLLADF